MKNFLILLLLFPALSSCSDSSSVPVKKDNIRIMSEGVNGGNYEINFNLNQNDGDDLYASFLTDHKGNTKILLYKNEIKYSSLIERKKGQYFIKIPFAGTPDTPLTGTYKVNINFNDAHNCNVIVNY